MKPSDILTGGNGVTQPTGGRMDFRTWLGGNDGEGGTNPWYTHRVEAVTQNFTSPKFNQDMFGAIETTIDMNFTYRGETDLKVWKASFQTTDVNKNLVYPLEFTRTLSLNMDYLSTGYALNTMTWKTSEEWSQLTQNYERSMLQNQRFYVLNKTLYWIVQTALATGNFKVIPGLTSSDNPEDPQNKIAYRHLRNAAVAYEMRWTTQNKGIPNNYQILFAPYALQGALESAGQTSITASESMYANYIRGEATRWYGFNIREFPWLENNYFFNVDVSEDQRLQSNATGEDFDFTKVSAVFWAPETIIRKQFQPFFTLGENGNFSGFFYQAFVGGSNVVDLARVFNFNLNVFIRPFMESKNMVIFNVMPSDDEIKNARKLLKQTYPTLYQGIKDDGTMDAIGELTWENVLAQWRSAAQKYKYSTQEANLSIPYDSNIYGFKANLVNTNGISKVQMDKQKAGRTR